MRLPDPQFGISDWQSFPEHLLEVEYCNAQLDYMMLQFQKDRFCEIVQILRFSQLPRGRPGRVEVSIFLAVASQHLEMHSMKTTRQFEVRQQLNS